MFEARRTLETTYQQMGRGLSTTSVDPEGSAIWITEYLRYRTNACDHADAEAEGLLADRRRTRAADLLRAMQLRAQPGRRQHQLDVEHAGIRSASGERRLAAVHVDGDEHRAVADVRQHAVARHRLSRRSPTTSRRTTAAPAPGSSTSRGRVAPRATRSTRQEIAVCAIVHDGRSVPLIGPDDGVPVPERGDAVQFHRDRRTCRAAAPTPITGRPATSMARRRRSCRTAPRTCSPFTDACGGPGATVRRRRRLNCSSRVTITDSLGNAVTLRSGEGNQPPLSVRLFTC